MTNVNNFQIYDTLKEDQEIPLYFGGNYRLLPRPQGSLYVRVDAAVLEFGDGLDPVHLNNGDEERYTNKIGNYSKALSHNSLGEVNLNSYNSLLNAIELKTPQSFDSIPLGGTVKLTNPQSGLAFDLEGVDAMRTQLLPAPALASNEATSELIENYWMALCRDINFLDYSTNPLTISAAQNLSSLPDFTGPKVSGSVTPSTLFRGSTVGDLVGPYVSQFLYLDVPFGPMNYQQLMKTYLPNTDAMTTYNEWLNIQNGSLPSQPQQFDPVKRYIRNGRDLSEWVHMDVLYQAYFQAMLVCFGLNVPFSSTNPYITSLNQSGFGTFGQPHIATLVTEGATRALKCAWFQKWFVNRKLRPEEFGGLVHLNLTGQTNYPLNPILNNSQTALVNTFNQFGTYLLPQAFPEGSPTHPSYPAGHATVAGCCVTMLKAFFDCNFVIPNPVVPDSNGLTLVPYVGPPLTVGNELNKLAANVGIGRNHAGVHYRSDYWNSLLLGEKVAVSILQDQIKTYNENFSGWVFTGFEGNTIVVN